MECEHTRKFCRALEALGAKTYPAVASQYSPLGWPDRWVGKAIWAGWLEFKAYDGRVKPEQIDQINSIRAAGTDAFVCRFSQDWTQFRLEDPDGAVRSEWSKWSRFFEVVQRC